MSQILIELSDRVFTAIQKKADIVGVLPEHLIAALLEQEFGQVFKLLLTEAEKEEARARFGRHFGTVSFDCAAEVDNQSIDADLAREYANINS